jgi:hypothetical protein
MISRSLSFFFLLTLPFFAFPQKRINDYKRNQRHGRWIVYHDVNSGSIDNIGKYRKGIPVGTWKYYDPQGHLIKKEKYRFRKVHIHEYHPNGKIRKKGTAKTVTTDKMIHYFYYGNWKVYDSSGTVIKKQFYKEGNKISEVCYRTEKGNVNDSLVEILRKLNSDILLYSDSVLYAERNYGKESKEYQRYVSLSNLNAYKVFGQIDKIIENFGYPGRSIAGDDYAIVFSIISSANLEYKEKYYSIIIEAADKKELDWSDVAFFVDKVKVGRKEKQLYGTQYKIVGNKVFYYPVEDKTHLNERRKKVGLEEADLSQMNDSLTY